MAHHHHLGYTHKVEKGKDSLVSVMVDVDADTYNHFLEHAFHDLAAEVKIPGFRPGKAPRAQVESALGTKLVSEAVRHLLPEIAAEIVDKEEMNPVTELDYVVEEISEQGGLKYSFTFTNYPEIKLGNLSKLGIKKETQAAITDAEIDEVLVRLFKQDKAENKKSITPDSVTDSMVEELKMDGISTVEKLKDQIRSRLSVTKQSELDRKHEAQVLEAAVKASEIPIPSKLLEQQTEALMEGYKQRITELQVDLDDFLQAQGLDPEKLKEQKQQEALERLQTELLLNKIVQEYELTPKLEDIQAEIDSVRDAQTKERLDTPAGRRYVLSTIIAQRGMEKLLELAGR